MIKRLARKLVTDGQWSFVQSSRARFGLVPAALGYLTILVRRGISCLPNTVCPGYVFLRPETADINVYEEIFLAKEYDIDLGDPKFIVDAGAHIGLSSVYFASKYPSAVIVAVEPEATNFLLLKKNTKKHRNIVPIQAGLWCTQARLCIENLTAATWSFRVKEVDDKDGIAAVSVGDIMKQFGVDRIDVLKIDIEGAEVEVLRDSSNWLGSVDTLVIELHDRFRAGCSEALETALDGYNYHRTNSGESVVISRIRHKRA